MVARFTNHRLQLLHAKGFLLFLLRNNAAGENAANFATCCASYQVPGWIVQLRKNMLAIYMRYVELSSSDAI